MKRLISGLIVFLLVLAACAAPADTMVQVQIDLSYKYDMTECMLDMINEFRTGGKAWVWDEKDENKVPVTGLSPLTYDYGLERTAMTRAAECAVHYAHVRPDGSDCWTVYPASGSLGENIAAGYMSTSSVFDGWKEEDELYAGQGHRRNMLNSGFTRVGVGCAYASGTYYWCMALGSSSTGEGRSSLTGPATVTASMEILTMDGMSDMTASPDTLKIREGSTAAVPKVKANSGNWGQPKITLLDPPWKVSDTKVVKIGEDGKITALKGGKATLTIDLGKKVSVKVVSVCNNHTWDAGTVTKEPTCAAKGARTKTCTVCGETETEELAKLPHTLSAVKRAEPTCTKDGHEAYWKCSGCGKLFSDAKGTKVISKPVAIAKLGHDWGEVSYTWADDYNKVTAKRVCRRDGKHTEEETVAATRKVIEEATTKKAGSCVWTSKAFKNKAFKVQKITVEIPKYPAVYADRNCRYRIKDDLTAVVTGPAKDSQTKVIIPDTIEVNGREMKVVEIDAKAFSNMKKLTKATIGKNVAKIGAKAFAGCGKLKSVTIKCAKMKKNGFGAGCFSKINKKAAFKVPKKMLKKYQDWIIRKGKAPKTVKVK